MALADRIAIAEFPLEVDAAPGSALLLVARVAGDGRVEVVGHLAGSALVELFRTARRVKD